MSHHTDRRILAIETPEEEQTRALARLVAQLLRGGDLVILSGGLGAGKTFFTRELAYGLGLDEDEPVTSPTFTLVHEYPTAPELLHSDLYRLAEPEEVEELGLEQQREQGALLVVEWGRPFARELGGNAIYVDLEPQPHAARVSGDEPRAREFIAALELSLQDYAAGAAGPKLPFAWLGSDATDGEA